jgi:hypothetical protein
MSLLREGIGFWKWLEGFPGLVGRSLDTADIVREAVLRQNDVPKCPHDIH